MGFPSSCYVDDVDRPGLHPENPYCVRFAVRDSMLARQGAMVAHRGSLTISTKGQGVRNLLKRAVTREGLALMEVSGEGEIWLADRGRNVVVVDGDGLSVTGRSVLCFDRSLSYDIDLMKAGGMAGGGLFNCRFTGRGSLALTSQGQPLVIPVRPERPLFVDTDAVIGWSSALAASLHRSESLRSLLHGGSGEAFQVRLDGSGLAVVQPGEAAALPKKDPVGAVVEGLLG